MNQRSDLGPDITDMSRDAMAMLEGDDWPGNVRELEAVVNARWFAVAPDG